MAPGQTIDKRWQVRNSGSCNWDQRYSLRLISGDAMGSDGSVPLYPGAGGRRGNAANPIHGAAGTGHLSVSMAGRES